MQQLCGASSRQSGVGTRGSRQLDTALLVAEQLKRPILRMPNKEEVAAMDKLIAEVASPRTKRVLADYKQEGKVCILHMNLTSVLHAIAVALICYALGLFSHTLRCLGHMLHLGCDKVWRSFEIMVLSRLSGTSLAAV